MARINKTALTREIFDHLIAPPKGRRFGYVMMYRNLREIEMMSKDGRKFLVSVTEIH